MPKFQIELELSSINDRILLTNFDSSENLNGGITFNESLSEEENGLYRLTFSIPEKLYDYPDIDMSKVIAIGRPIWLQLYEPQRSIRMAITSFSPVIGSENIIYEIEAQDYASYTFSRNNAGLTLDTFEDEEFLDWLRLYGKTTMNFLGSLFDKPEATPTTTTSEPTTTTEPVITTTLAPVPPPGEIWSFLAEYPGPTAPISTDQGIVEGLGNCSNYSQEQAQLFINETLNPSGYPVGYKVEVRPSIFTPSSCSLFVFEANLDPNPAPIIMSAFAGIKRNSPAGWYLEVEAEWESLGSDVSGTTVINTGTSLVELTNSLLNGTDFRIIVPLSIIIDNITYSFVRWVFNSNNQTVGENTLDIFINKNDFNNIILEAIYEDITELS